MMAGQQRDNSGALFKNEKTNPKQPDYNGPCKVNGGEMRVAAWLEKDKSGNPYLSLKFSEKYDGNNQQPKQAQQLSNDDIPF